MKKVLIFGSSGSIGRNALEVIRKDKDNFRVLGLSVNKNIGILKKQIEEFMPRYVCVTDETKAKVLREEIPSGTKLFSGSRGLEEFSAIGSDISIMGIVGITSLKPLLINISKTKRIALASKEAIVAGGALVKKEVAQHNTEIIPVDSEINALFQLFKLVDKNQLKKVYLTASGGPLLGYTRKQIRNVTPREVLSHPTWQMGKRITVDSATLVNKGFEVIEAHCLFDLDYHAIDIVIHKQSMIHALLETKDNTLFACLYNPSMKIPLAFSLYYPRRCHHLGGLDFSFTRSALSFSRIRYKDFPSLCIVIEAAKIGANFPVVINAADEVAIDYFLKEKISFYDIYRSLEYIFSKTEKVSVGNLGDIYYWDTWSREKTKRFLNKLCQ